MQIGVDISTLLETEALGGRFYDKNGVEKELFDILIDYGVNSVRLRLWNDPFDSNGNSYMAGGCDIETVVTLAKRAKNKGMSFLLDFHYSDFWCDPSRQLLPKAWRGKTLSELCELVYTYTKDTLIRLKNEGAEPEYVQIGNEITGGMLWSAGQITYDEKTQKRTGYENLSKLLIAGVKAVREFAARKTQILLHLERSGDNECYRDWFDNIVKNGVDFDVIAVSYYPFWHGDFNALSFNLKDMASRYNKDLMLVETSYAFTDKHYNGKGNINLVVNANSRLPCGGNPPYPLTKEGQKNYLKDLILTLKKIERFKGFYYWEPAWLPLEGSSWASEGARIYMNETHKKGGNEWANQCLFDYNGKALPALEELKSI